MWPQTFSNFLKLLIMKFHCKFLTDYEKTFPVRHKLPPATLAPTSTRFTSSMSSIKLEFRVTYTTHFPVSGLETLKGDEKWEIGKN